MTNTAAHQYSHEENLSLTALSLVVAALAPTAKA
jgi:hypothetical protein